MLKDHLGKLEYFVHVVEAKSMLKASQKAFVSQPQLSKIVRQLEEDLGEKLLLRHKAGIEVTEAGHNLYLYAKKVINGANETQLLLKNKKDLNGVLKVGTYDSISRYFFPDFLRYMNHALPDLDIVLTTGRSTPILEKLQKRELDIAVVVKPKKKFSELKFVKIYSDTFGCYTSPKIEDHFKKYLIIFPGAVSNSENHTEILGMEQVITCDNLETVKSLVEEGMGVGFLPHRVAREGVLKGTLIQFHRENVPTHPHDIVLAFSKENDSELRTLLVENLQRYLVSWSLN